MARHPVLYLSAPTADLQSTRLLAQTALAKRNCSVATLDLTSVPEKNIAELVRKRLTGADLVLQIIGYRKPLMVPLDGTNDTSIYLHALEGELAKAQGIPVHPIFLTEEYPTDFFDDGDEDPDLSERHHYWRTLMRSDLLLHIPLNAAELASHLRTLYLGPFYRSSNLGGGFNQLVLEAAS